MMYDLPTSLNVNGTEYKIRSDYRAVLDICAALSDSSMSDRERFFSVLIVLYEDFDAMPPDDYEEAARQAMWFINCGNSDSQHKRPKLMDWEKDFQWIVAPINHVAGEEIRAAKYLHWWTFISYYYEIGDCTFAQIVSIRKKLKSGKRLDKWEQEFYRDNREYIDIDTKLNAGELNILEQLQKG